MPIESTSSESDRRKILHDMLVRLRDETDQRINELRHEQGEDIEPQPRDEMDRASASADAATHASLIDAPLGREEPRRVSQSSDEEQSPQRRNNDAHRGVPSARP